jgi:hypothetical protein
LEADLEIKMTTLARAISYSGVQINLSPFKIAAMFAGAIFLAEFAVAFGLEVWFY